MQIFLSFSSASLIFYTSGQKTLQANRIQIEVTLSLILKVTLIDLKFILMFSLKLAIKSVCTYYLKLNRTMPKAQTIKAAARTTLQKKGRDFKWTATLTASIASVLSSVTTISPWLCQIWPSAGNHCRRWLQSRYQCASSSSYSLGRILALASGQQYER